jgi:RNA polymerase sigma-70 factor (ECF subfamily)
MQTKILKKATGIERESLLTEDQALDASHFIRLYDEYYSRVFNYAYFRCYDAMVADDLTALAFEKAMASFDDFDPNRGTFAAWLFAITRNVFNNHLRAAKKQDWLSLETCQDPISQELSPEESLIRDESQYELLRGISKLSERERDLISLKFASGLTNRRIADITGFTENHVAVILFRAIHRLRTILEEGKS